MSEKVNSKQKGNSFERKICHLLQDLTGIKFRRTFGSGAYKQNFEAAHELGDVRPENPDDFLDFRFVVECKFYKEIPYHQIMAGDCTLLDKWLDQVLSDSNEREKNCDGSIFPLLIFTSNRKPMFFATHEALFSSGAATSLCYKNRWAIAEIKTLKSVLDRVSHVYGRQK